MPCGFLYKVKAHRLTIFTCNRLDTLFLRPSCTGFHPPAFVCKSHTPRKRRGKPDGFFCRSGDSRTRVCRLFLLSFSTLLNKKHPRFGKGAFSDDCGLPPGACLVAQTRCAAKADTLLETASGVAPDSWVCQSQVDFRRHNTRKIRALQAEIMKPM